MYAPSVAASDARSEAAGDAGTSSRPSDNADEAAPPAPEGLVGPPELDVHQNKSPPAYVTVITKRGTKEAEMKNVTFILIITVALGGVLLPANPSTQQSKSAEVLLGAALHQEEVEGNLEAAIKTYQKILAEHSGNRPLAAKALLQIGRCYERLGKDEARKAYERLVRDYADQSEQAKLARARLTALSKTADANRELTFSTRQVWADFSLGFSMGAVSPDGRYFSFVDLVGGADLAIRDLETGTIRHLTNERPLEKSTGAINFPTWSPDGKQIAYSWWDGKSQHLRAIAREGGKPRTLFDCKSDEGMKLYDWSSDGKQILILFRNQAMEFQIVLVSAADGTTRVLKTFQAGSMRRQPQTMRFSSDGRYIAYDYTPGGKSQETDISLISTDGSNEVSLVKHPAQDYLLGWPSTREGILFVSDRTGSFDLWFLPVSAGKAQGGPELVKKGVGQIQPVGFTQSGSYYYMPKQDQDRITDVYVVRMDPQSGKILSPPETLSGRFEGYNSWPGYSPDGKYLAYTTRRNPPSEMYLTNILRIRSLETGKEQEFSTKFSIVTCPRWSPNSQFIYFGAGDDQGTGIHRVNTQNGEITPIVRVERPSQIDRLEASPDGNSIVYEKRRAKPDEPCRILSRDLSTGEEKLLYAGECTVFSISPDGSWLALIDQGWKKVLRVMPASGGQPKELLRFEDKIGLFKSDLLPVFIEWTADGKHILFPRLRQLKDGRQFDFALWRIAAEGGEPQELNLAMSYLLDMSAHPDGQHLAFDSGGSTSRGPAIWVMENFLPPAARKERLK
jgi:Tol biopolymer transport system component